MYSVCYATYANHLTLIGGDTFYLKFWVNVLNFGHLHFAN